MTSAQRLRVARQLVVPQTVVWLVSLTALALGLRVWLLRTSLQTIDGDESILGLMALRVLQGDRPVLYWGQPYQGSLEAYLTAGVFALAGSDAFTLRVVPFLCSAAFVPAVYWLGVVAFDRRTALWSAIYAALAPTLLIARGLKAGSGHVEVLLLGTLALALGLKLLTREWTRPGLWGLLGLLLGLALWTHPVAVLYPVALAVGSLPALWWQRRFLFRRSCLGRIGLLTGGLVLPLVPLIGHNVLNGFEIIGFLWGGTGRDWAEFVRHGEGFGRVGLAVVLGALQPGTTEVLVNEQLARRALLRRVVAALGLFVLYPLALWVTLKSLTEAFHQHVVSRALPLLALALGAPLLFVSSRYGFIASEPRYLLPLYSTIPLFAAGLLALPRRPLPVGALLGILLLGINIWGILTIDPRLNRPYLHGQSLPVSNQALLDFLARENIRHIYADYWVANWVTFETRERVASFAIARDLTVGFNRSQYYADSVLRAENPAWVLIRGSPDEDRLLEKLDRSTQNYRRAEVSIYAVYYDFSEPVRPVNLTG